MKALQGDINLPIPIDFLNFIFAFIVRQRDGEVLPHSYKHMWDCIGERAHWYLLSIHLFAGHFKTSNAVKVAAVLMQVIKDIEQVNWPEYTRPLELFKYDFYKFRMGYLQKQQ
jgi:hypothetical protein